MTWPRPTCCGASTSTQLITNHHPYADFDTALHQHTADEIKAVIEWNSL